jgi:hypothetical protein
MLDTAIISHFSLAMIAIRPCPERNAGSYMFWRCLISQYGSLSVFV